MINVLNKVHEKGFLKLVLFMFFAANFLYISTKIGYSQNDKLIKIESARKIVCAGNKSNSVIAIIDGGILTSHLSLKDVIWINKNEILNDNDNDSNGYIDDVLGWNFANCTNDISNNGLGNWHGTPVNGIIHSIANNPNESNHTSVKLMNIVKDESIESIMESLMYVYRMRKLYNNSDGQKGAFVVAINCSWGKEMLWGRDYPEWCSIYDSLGREGVVVVSSVPNANTNIDIHGDMPATCFSDFVITVTNSNANDQKVFEAGYGKFTVDLAAPGEGTYTTLNTGNYGFFDGTSAAAPYVTAAIGMLYSIPSQKLRQHVKENPSEVAKLVKRVILEGVDRIPSLEELTVSGGRLNIYSSMKLLLDHYGEEHLYQNIFESLQIISVYPNPAKASTTLVLESNKQRSIGVDIVNMSGTAVKRYEFNVSKGIQHIPLCLSNISKGVYIIHLSSNNLQSNTKLIIQ